MSYLNPRVLDYGLHSLALETTRLVFQAIEPVDYETATVAVIAESLPPFNGPADAPTGRKVTVGPVIDGLVQVDGTIHSWALVDDRNRRLLATDLVTNPLDVLAGNIATLAAFDIVMPGVVIAS